MSDNKKQIQHEAHCDSTNIKIEPADISTGIPFDIVYIKEDNIECEVENVSILEEKTFKTEEICSELNTSKRKCGSKDNPRRLASATILGEGTTRAQDRKRTHGAVTKKSVNLKHKKPLQKSNQIRNNANLNLNKSQFLTNRLTKGYQKCGICNINFYSQSTYEAHKKIHTTEIRNLQIRNGNLLISKAQSDNRCKNCGKIFTAKQLLSLHVTICKKLATSSGDPQDRDELTVESSEKKKNRGVFECNDDKVKFVTKQSRAAQRQSHGEPIDRQ